MTLLWAVLLLQLSRGRLFAVHNDHDALKWILAQKDLREKLVGWRLRLSQFKFDVEHCTGTRHQATGALLLLQTAGADETAREDDIAVLCFTISICPETEEPRCMYMQENDTASDKQGVELSHLYGLVTEPGGNDEK